MSPEKEIGQCRYSNTDAPTAGTRWSFWREGPASISISASDAIAQSWRSCCRTSPSDAAHRRRCAASAPAAHARPAPARAPAICLECEGYCEGSAGGRSPERPARRTLYSRKCWQIRRCIDSYTSLEGCFGLGGAADLGWGGDGVGLDSVGFGLVAALG